MNIFQVEAKNCRYRNVDVSGKEKKRHVIISEVSEGIGTTKLILRIEPDCETCS